MHHTSKCLTDTGQSFVSLSEVELSSSSESSLSSPGLEFGVSPYFSLTLWPTHRLPGLLISHSSRRGQRAGASWEKERREGELPRQVKGSRKDILLICCWDPETDQRLWQVSSAPLHIIPPPPPPVNSTLQGASQFSPACRDGWWESIHLISPPRTPRPATPLRPARLTDSWACVPQNPYSNGE